MGKQTTPITRITERCDRWGEIVVELEWLAIEDDDSRMKSWLSDLIETIEHQLPQEYWKLTRRVAVELDAEQAEQVRATLTDMEG